MIFWKFQENLGKVYEKILKNSVRFLKKSWKISVRSLKKSWKLSVRSSEKSLKSPKIELVQVYFWVNWIWFVFNFQLSKNLPPRSEGYPWTLVYSSDLHGFSLKTLYRSMQNIDSQILLILRDTRHTVSQSFCFSLINGLQLRSVWF